MSLSIQKNISLKDYTTLKAGGVAQFFCVVKTQEELREAFLWARTEGYAWRVIGGGSNILCDDGVIEGLTIKNELEWIVTEMYEERVHVRAGAGVPLDTLVAYTCKHSWWGLENLSHIPGTVGATPVQNVGAYGVEVADRIHEVLVYDTNADVFKTLSPLECAFGYRHSLFKEPEGKKYILCEVTFICHTEDASVLTYRDLALHFRDMSVSLTPSDVRDVVIAIRSKKFPDWRTVGTAGSFFKNPIVSTEIYKELCMKYEAMPGHVVSATETKIPLGWILEHVCGLRGVREGLVGTYHAQALVLINYGGATAREIHAFAQKIQQCVKEKTTIDIEYEVTHITSK